MRNAFVMPWTKQAGFHPADLFFPAICVCLRDGGASTGVNRAHSGRIWFALANDPDPVIGEVAMGLFEADLRHVTSGAVLLRDSAQLGLAALCVAGLAFGVVCDRRTLQIRMRLMACGALDTV